MATSPSFFRVARPSLLRTAVHARPLPLVRVEPKEWQRLAFAGRTRPKTYAERKRHALRLARERWPGARLDRVKDSGIADALWIAAAVATERGTGR